jgi:hypothetical protein
LGGGGCKGAEAREKLKEINMSPSERAAYNRYMDELSLEASLAETIKFEEVRVTLTGLKYTGIQYG